MARARMLKNIEYVTWYSHFWHAVSKQYAAIMTRNEAKSCYDQIDFELIGSNIIEKKNIADSDNHKDNCTFSVVYSLLKTKSKTHILKIPLKFLEICSKHIFAWYWDFTPVLFW